MAGGRKPKSEEQKSLENDLLNLGRTPARKRIVKNSSETDKIMAPKNSNITPAPPVEPPVPPVEPPAPPVPPVEPPAPPVEPSSNVESSKNEHQPNKNHDPLSGPVDTRTYQTRQVDPNISAPIPEAEFVIEGPKIVTDPKPPIAPPPGPKTAPVNPIPGSQQLPPAEARRGAEMITDMILSGYKTAHKIAYKLVEVDDNRLINLHIDGKIDMNMRIPLNAEQTKHLVLTDFFKSFNSQAKTALTVSQQFIDSVREPMINCCIKWGWTAPEEYYVLYKFGEDIGIKVMMVAGLMKSTKQMMKMFMYAHEENKKMHQEKIRMHEEQMAQNNTPAPEKQQTEKKAEPATA